MSKKRKDSIGVGRTEVLREKAEHALAVEVLGVPEGSKKAPSMGIGDGKGVRGMQKERSGSTL